MKPLSIIRDGGRTQRLSSDVERIQLNMGCSMIMGPATVSKAQGHDHAFLTDGIQLISRA